MAFEALKQSIQAETAAFAERITAKALVSFSEELTQQLKGHFQTVAPVLDKPAPAKAKPGRPATAKGPCNVKDCQAKVVAKGLCSKHYQKQRERLKAKAEAISKSEAAAIAAGANGAAAPVTA